MVVVDALVKKVAQKVRFLNVFQSLQYSVELHLQARGWPQHFQHFGSEFIEVIIGETEADVQHGISGHGARQEHFESWRFVLQALVALARQDDAVGISALRVTILLCGKKLRLTRRSRES